MEAAHRHDEQRETGTTVTAFPIHTKPANTPADPIIEVFNEPEIEAGIRFTNDGALLQAKGGDPETLQGTFAYITQLLQHLGISLGMEGLREVHLVGTEQRAVCVISDHTTTAVVASGKSNLSALAAKLS